MFKKSTITESTGSIRHPSSNFIKFLILSRQNVQASLKKYELPPIDEKTLEELKTSIEETPKGFDPKNKFHKESMDFLKSHGIYSLLVYDKNTEGAFKILKDPDIRLHVEDMLIAKTKPLEIAKLINTKFDSIFTEDDIDRYRHYFWNVKVMRINDWSKVYANQSERSKVNRLISGGPSYAKYRLGGFHQKIEAKQLMADALAVIKYDMEQIKHDSASESKTKMISQMVSTIGEIDDRLSTMDVTMKETLDQFKAFRLNHIEAKIMPINKTASIGNFTGSGMLLPEIENEELKLLDSQSKIIIEANMEDND